MAATPLALSTKDNAEGALDATISPSALSIPLESGDGADFPQPYNGTATSSGTSTTLNSTGISAAIGGSAAVGKFIWNKTDGSIAVITAVATNSVTTTRLLGGSDNTWDSADVWCIDPFVVTLGELDTNQYGVESDGDLEEALVIGRSTDTLTVASGGRGYNGTVAQQFDAGDKVYLRVTSPILERFKDLVSVMAQQQDTDRTTLGTATTNITNLQTGAYHYVETTGSANAYVAATPALAAYAAGNLVVFKANFTNSGSATLNLNGLGAKTIKKNDGATNLSANDIVSGQVVVVRYDGTNFQMLSPVGTPTTIQYYDKTVYASGASNTNAASFNGSTSQINIDTHNYAIGASDLVAGVGYEFEFAYSAVVDSSPTITFAIRLGTTNIVTVTTATSGTGTVTGRIKGFLMGTAAAGASVAVRGVMSVESEQDAGDAKYAAANVATNGGLTLQLSGQYNASNASHALTVTMAKFRKVSSSLFT